MPEYVFAISESFVSDLQGGVRLLVLNEAFPPDHPIVKANPGLFSDSPFYRDDQGNGFEATTTNPGELRNVRRGR